MMISVIAMDTSARNRYVAAVRMKSKATAKRPKNVIFNVSASGCKRHRCEIFFRTLDSPYVGRLAYHPT